MNFIPFQTHDGVANRQKWASSTPTLLYFQSSYQSCLRNLCCIEKMVLLPKEPCRNGFHASRRGTSTSQTLCILADLFNSVSTNWMIIQEDIHQPTTESAQQIRCSQDITFIWWVRSTCIQWNSSTPLSLPFYFITMVIKMTMKNYIFTSMCSRKRKTDWVSTNK